jgi:hypothetical protein
MTRKLFYVVTAAISGTDQSTSTMHRRRLLRRSTEGLPVPCPLVFSYPGPDSAG